MHGARSWEAASSTARLVAPETWRALRSSPSKLSLRLYYMLSSADHCRHTMSSLFSLQNTSEQCQWQPKPMTWLVLPSSAVEAQRGGCWPRCPSGLVSDSCIRLSAEMHSWVVSIQDFSFQNAFPRLSFGDSDKEATLFACAKYHKRTRRGRT